MSKITKNINFIFDDYLLLNIFNYLNLDDLSNLIISCKIFYNVLIKRISNIKLVIKFHNYCVNISQENKLIYTDHNNNRNILDSYYKIKFYYYSFYFFKNNLIREEIINKIKNKGEELIKENIMYRDFRVRLWSIDAERKLSILFYKKNFVAL